MAFQGFWSIKLGMSGESLASQMIICLAGRIPRFQGQVVSMEVLPSQVTNTG